jgi:hypothetical protein
LGSGWERAMKRFTHDEIENAHAKYLPTNRIKVLFVGESLPSNGSYFYCGDNALLREMRCAVGGPEGDDDFLKSFMERGWYLDDLVQTPINDRSELKKKCREARDSLAIRIAKYKPAAIVCLLRRIRDDVEVAALMADSEACCYTVSFPPQHPRRFREEMKLILPRLERLP